ncbi:hypothetical protein AB0E59_41250 [Lentzea sp. NPDC034063]|uniref:hypothetical protein n=1 Tax=unclassified Lentzea TaxID=2643253 RepID=UPI0033C45A33
MPTSRQLTRLAIAAGLLVCGVVLPIGSAAAGSNGQHVSACGKQSGPVEAAAVVGKNHQGHDDWTEARRFTYSEDGLPCVNFPDKWWVGKVQINWYYPPSQSGGPFRYAYSTSCHVPVQQNGDWVKCRLL